MARKQTATAQIDFTASDRKTKRLIDVKGIGKRSAGAGCFRT